MRPRWLAFAGILSGVSALVAVSPPILARPVAVPIVLGAIGIAAGVVALRRGAGTLGGFSIAAGVCGVFLGALLAQASTETVSALVTAGLFAATLQWATPLTFAGVGGLLAERSGVTNIGLDGMMLVGAFFGVLVDDKTDSWVIGLLGAAGAGGVFALIHAFFSIHLQADQIVSGTAINILAAGGTAFLFRAIYGTSGNPSVAQIPDVHVPGLRSVPYLGDVVGTMNLMIWLMFALVVGSWFFIFRTPWGLRLRAVGEHPRAADTVGVSVYRVRYLAVTASGVLAALGGAYIAFGILSSFNEGLTVGRGFIALAAVIFGKWRPFGVLGATLLFGFSIALGFNLQSAVSGLSVFWQFVINALPYVATLIAVVGLVGRSTPPAAAGRPYAKR